MIDSLMPSFSVQARLFEKVAREVFANELVVRDVAD